MTYTTGSGDIDDLLDDILAQASTDGWTLTGGTDFPISKGNLAFDYTKEDTTETDVTTGGEGGSKAVQYLRLGIAGSTANATSDAAATVTKVPNIHFPLLEYHIFSDPSLCDYIHAVYRFNNGVDPDVWGHFSFGQIDKGGLTYGDALYATGNGARGYALDTSNGVTAGDWNSLNRTRNGWSGAVGHGDDGTAVLSFFLDSTSMPTPDGSGGWPASETNYYAGEKVWGMGFRLATDPNSGSPEIGQGGAPSLTYGGWISTPPAQTGTVTLMPIPFFVINDASSSARMRFLGTFPNVRKCAMNGLAPGDEIEYGSDTWKIFPLLKNTPNSLLTTASIVTSGRAGIAFKKVE